MGARTYREAAVAQGLWEDTEEVARTLEEAIAVETSPRRLAQLFPQSDGVGESHAETAPPLSELEMIAILGVGGYGMVKLAQWRPTGQSFALKLMSKKHILAKKQACTSHSPTACTVAPSK